MAYRARGFEIRRYRHRLLISLELAQYQGRNFAPPPHFWTGEGIYSVYEGGPWVHHYPSVGGVERGVNPDVLRPQMSVGSVRRIPTIVPQVGPGIPLFHTMIPLPADLVAYEIRRRNGGSPYSPV